MPLKLAVAFIMFVGLVLTLVPRVPGTLVILLGALLYGAFVDISYASTWVWAALLSLMAVAEIGGRGLRLWLTRPFALSRKFSTDSTLGNIGGIMVADALLGPVVGFIIWELVAGKTLEPRWNTIVKILLRLAAAAAVRFVCGLAMIIIVLVYIFQ